MDTRLTMLALGAGTTLLPATSLAAPTIYSYDFESANTDSAAIWSSNERNNLGGTYTTVLGRFNNTGVSLRLNANEQNTAGLGGANDGPGTGGGNSFNLQHRQIRADRIRIPLPDSTGSNGARPDNPYVNNLPGHTFDLGGGWGGGDDQPSGDPVFTAGAYALTFDLMIFDSWDANNVGYGPDKFTVNINGETVFDELFEIHWLPNNFRMPDELPELNAYHLSWQDQIYRDITLQFDIDSDTDHFDFEFIGTLDQWINDESWGIDNVRVEAMGRVAPAAAPAVPAPASLTLLATGLGLVSRRRR